MVIRNLLSSAIVLSGILIGSMKAEAQLPDTTIVRLMQEKHVPILGVAFLENGSVASAKVFGERQPGIPASVNTVFNVASITKTITAMVTLRLVDAGKWNLDEPLYHYWTDPDVAADPRSKKLTTRHVLTHQTGFPNWRWMTPGKKLAFQFEPGLRFEYSGEGMEYLRHAMEHKFHRLLEQLADSIIFHPLGMNDTHLVWDDSMQEKFAVPHNAKGEPLPIVKNSEPSAADQLKTTVGDYSKFLSWMLKGADLSKSLFRQLTTPAARIKDNKFMGLGWVIYPDCKGEVALSHSGIDPGANTIAFLLPKSKRALLIFTNSDNGPQLYTDLVEGFLKETGKAIVETEMKD